MSGGGWVGMCQKAAARLPETHQVVVRLGYINYLRRTRTWCVSGISDRKALVPPSLIRDAPCGGASRVYGIPETHHHLVRLGYGGEGGAPRRAATN